MKYDLYAVVVHSGFSSTSGHYFCFVRSAPDTWHKLDDSKVASSELVPLSRHLIVLHRMCLMISVDSVLMAILFLQK